MKLYYASYSPPSRAVLLAADHMGVSFEPHIVDILKGEQFAPEYEEVNPMKKIPFLVDDEFQLGESRAILVYLAEKYGQDSGLLPSEPDERALVNLALHFDIGTLFKSTAQYYFPVLFGSDEYSPEKYDKLREAFDVLETMLDGKDYVAGANLSIADLSLVASVTTAEAFGFELDDYENVRNWIDRVKESTPGYEKINVEGVEMLKSLVAEKTGS